MGILQTSPLPNLFLVVPGDTKLELPIPVCQLKDLKTWQNGEGHQVLRYTGSKLRLETWRSEKVNSNTPKVSPNATDAELKTAYKKGALKHHPGGSSILAH